MNEYELERHRIIVKNCNNLINVAFDIDKQIIRAIMKKSQDVLDFYNNKEKVAIDATKIEIGKWKSSVKKIILGKTINVYNRKNNHHQYDTWDIRNEIKNACDNTPFSEYLKESYIHLYRKCDWTNKNDLQKAILESLRTQIIIEFTQHNPQIINKYS